MTLFTFFTFFYLLFHSSIYASRTPTNATASKTLANINATETPPETIKIKLIPRRSIFPPAIVKTDYNDYDYINDESVMAFLSLDEEQNIFLASIQIGEPPVPLLLLPDTGSSLTYVKSTLCIGCEGTTVMPYDPSASSTYEHISCDSNYCQRVKGSTNGYSCGSMGQCMFRNRYGGSVQTIVEGDLGTEKLRFITYDQGITTIPKAVIGCTTFYQSRSKPLSGLLGLAYDKVSILHNMITPKFSYCVGSVFDGDNKYNHIILGEGAKLLGSSTPIRVRRLGRYFLTLEGISVGKKRLNIDPQIFKPINIYSGGVSIDTGTVLTFMVREAYEVLKSEIKNILGDFRLLNDNLMCYEGSISDIKGFPVVTFHFAEAAVLLLDVESMFVPHRFTFNVSCLTVRPSDSNNFGSLTIIGMLAQQKHNIAYDLTQMRLYIDRIDCEFVDD